MKISDIHTNPNNPRLIKDDRFKKLVKSISDFPKMMELRPIIIDNEGMILGGNMRFKALKELKYKDIPDKWIKRADELTDAEKQEFIVKDNVGFGDWDFDSLENWDKDQLTDWGVELPEFYGEKLEAQEDDYKIPDEIKTDIVLGDLFEIGQHRLLCGDSIKADDVNKLIDGGKPNLMVTDPPYGVNYNPQWRHEAGVNKSKRIGKVQNDDNASWVDAYSLFTGSIVYIWHAGKHSHIIVQDLFKCGFELVSQIIWAKPQLVLSRGDYHWKHEPCWYAVRKGMKHNWVGNRSQTTLWEIAGMNKKGKSENEDEFNF